jgi:hypothetical protein
MTPTNEDAVIKFLADAKKQSWLSFHLIMLDGSFWPPSTPLPTLLTAAEKLGVAGFIGFIETGETITRLDRLWAETPEAEYALIQAGDALNPTAAIVEQPATMN